MPDAGTHPVKLSALAKRTPRSMALDTAREIERACAWQDVPDKPFTILHLTRKAVDDLRNDREETSKRLLVEWTDWTVAYSSAVADNIARLRGALWCWRTLRDIAAQNPGDHEAASFRDLVRAFLREEWRLPNPPADRIECADVARPVVESMASV